MENGASEAVKAGNVEESPQQLASGPASTTAAAAPPKTILVRKPPGHRFPNNPTNLVAPDTILTSEQILAEKMNLTDLHNAVPDKVLAGFQWCARRRLIANCMRHHDDGINDCFAKWVITAPPTTTDLSWYCAGCTKRRTLRTGSIFENHSISERQILLLLYCWANRFTTDQTKKECKTSENTLNCFNKLFRDICGRYNKRHPLKLGGYDGDGEGEQGHRLVVEVGRNFLSAVRRRKTNASRNAEQREGWLIYGVDRKTGAYFLQRTDDCQPQTVREVLAKYVLPGTRIITEGDWAKNMGFRESGYTHDMLRMQGPNKTKGFVDRKDPTLHTNNRKVVWKQINKTVSFQRQRDLEAYLHQLVFFKRVRVRGHGVFQSMILAIQEEYRAGSLWSPDECNMTSDQIFAWPGFGEPAKLDQCVQVNTGPGGHVLPHPAGFRQSVRAPGPVVFLPPTYPSIVPLSQGFRPSVRPAPVRLPAPPQQVAAPRLPLPPSLPTQPVPRVVRRVVIRLPAATSMSGQEANDTLARLAEVLKRRQPSSGEDADDGPSASKKVKTESADGDGDGEGQESGETEEGGEGEEDRDDGEPIMVAPTFETGVESSEEIEDGFDTKQEEFLIKEELHMP